MPRAGIRHLNKSHHTIHAWGQAVLVLGLGLEQGYDLIVKRSAGSFWRRWKVFDILTPICIGHSTSLFTQVCEARCSTVTGVQGCEKGASIKKLIATLGKAGDIIEKKPRFLNSGTMALVEISVEHPVELL